jgi:hypothetical protein
MVLGCFYWLLACRGTYNDSESRCGYFKLSSWPLLLCGSYPNIEYVNNCQHFYKNPRPLSIKRIAPNAITLARFSASSGRRLHPCAGLV